VIIRPVLLGFWAFGDRFESLHFPPAIVLTKKRKIIVTTPKKYYDQFGSSLQIISQRAFEAAVYKLSTAAKSPVGLTAPPPNNDQSESSLQIIDCSVFEAAGRKLPKTPKASVSFSWPYLSWRRCSWCCLLSHTK